MTDKQQIEEMKNILLNSGAVTFEENVQKLFRQFPKDEFYVSNKDGHLTIDYGKFAEDLYNTGYRQINEYNEVVSLTLDRVRKETAKEVLQEVRKVCGDYQWFKNLCEKYGVEVE